jgi:hypothetical protein
MLTASLTCYRSSLPKLRTEISCVNVGFVSRGDEREDGSLL